MRWLFSVLFLFSAPLAWGALGAEDLARIHLEALGGKERVTALAAVRATGQVTTGGKQVRFHLLAARPARLRIEIEGSGRTFVQGYDGKEDPWEFDTGAWPPRYQAMSQAAVRGFVADAEFDDPLVADPARGFTLESAGEVEADGKKMPRLLVRRNAQEAFVLLLDPETYLIAMRLEKRQSAEGKAVQVITRFDDYRPVEGVLLAHRITLVVDGRISQQTVIETVDPNPEFNAETFTRPKGAAAKAVK